MLNVKLPKSIPAQDVAQAMATVLMYNAVAHKVLDEGTAMRRHGDIRSRLEKCSDQQVLVEAEKVGFENGMQLVLETRLYNAQRDGGPDECKLLITPEDSSFDFCAMVLSGTVMGSPNSQKQLARKSLDFTLHIIHAEPLPTSH